MPTIEANYKDLQQLIGRKLSKKELEEAVLFVKGEVDSWQGNELKIDIKDTNRPDLWSAEGIARELRARLGIEKGIPKYKVGKSGLKVTIDKSVKEARPYTVSAVIKDVKITEQLLIQMIQLQEKVDGTFGRKRKESSTGIYDYDKIKGNILYYGAEPRKKKFVPLEFSAEMDLDEILDTHPKGKEYGHLLKGKKRYPVFEDEEGNVLSMPPIINSNYSGKVTKQARNLFIEVSGFNLEIINVGLKVIVMALADRGGKIESVTIKDANGKSFATPGFGTKKISFESGLVEKISGLKLSARQIIELLAKARMNAKISGKKVEVGFPDYRQDILHPVDIIEDILISYGYNSIEPQSVEMAVFGHERKESLFEDKVRDACVGMGLQEVLTFTLSSKEKQFREMGLKEQECVEIVNPVSAEWSIMRKMILPELLEFLAKNKRYEYPQKIFEVGKTLHLDSKEETGVSEKNSLCIVLADKKADYNEIKSHLDALCNVFGWKYSLKKADSPVFEKGLGARITIGKNKGALGVLSRKAMQNFGLKEKTVALELEF